MVGGRLGPGGIGGLPQQTHLRQREGTSERDALDIVGDQPYGARGARGLGASADSTLP